MHKDHWRTAVVYRVSFRRNHVLSERARVKPARIPARKDSSSPVETDRERDGEEQRPFVFVTFVFVTLHLFLLHDTCSCYITFVFVSLHLLHTHTHTQYREGQRQFVCVAHICCTHTHKRRLRADSISDKHRRPPWRYLLACCVLLGLFYHLLSPF